MNQDIKIALLLALHTPEQLEEIAEYFMRKGFQGAHEAMMIQRQYRANLEALGLFDSPHVTKDPEVMANLMVCINLAVDTLFASKAQEEMIGNMLESSLGVDKDTAEDIAESVIEEATNKTKLSILYQKIED